MRFHKFLNRVKQPFAVIGKGLKWCLRTTGHLFEAIIDSRLNMMILSFIIGFVMIVAASNLNIGSVEFDGKLTNPNNPDIFKVINEDIITFNNQQSDLMREGKAYAPKRPPLVKEVGYFWALNWSVFGVIIAPLITFCGLGVLHSMKSTLRTLCKHGMIRDEAFNKLSYENMAPKLESYLRRSRFLFFIVFFCVMAFMLSDWWGVVGQPLLYPETVTQQLSDKNMEFDWSVAALYKNIHVNSNGLLAFGLVGYILLAGLVPAFAFGVILSAVYFVGFLNSINKEESDYNLAAMPSEDQNDFHFGFKIFSALFNNLLMTCIFILMGLWLMLVQNIYLRDASHHNIFSFILDDVNVAVQAATLDLPFSQILKWLFEPAKIFVPNIQAVLSIMLFPLVCLLSLGLCWTMLRTTALKSKNYSLLHATQLAEEFGVDKTVIITRFKKMAVWPVGWITSKELLFVMLLLFFSLISYRMAIIPLAALTAKGIAVLYGLLKKPALYLVETLRGRQGAEISEE